MAAIPWEHGSLAQGNLCVVGGVEREVGGILGKLRESVRDRLLGPRPAAAVDRAPPGGVASRRAPGSL